ncbi:MAG TPA: transporter associated domain-containing protein [Rhodanobacteraceae bacterium]|nr:transporter associated domain-containing protein [Rhodanobacteraceae bacterium]
MSEDHSSTGPAHRSWWGRLGQILSGEPRNRGDLLDELRGAQGNGLLSADTLSMIEGAMRVTELRVDDVMIPRSQMIALSAEAPVDEIMATVIESGHSRFPVHAGENRESILGILLAKDLLKCLAADDDCDITAILRPAALIPETMPLNVLLAEFKLSHNHMAIVVDEYGGVAGLITIEDVLEEIVGEIDDEHDEEDEDVALVEKASDGSFVVSALTPIEELNAHLASDFSDEEFDTIGGLATAAFGHLPERGEEVELGGWLFHVTAADDRRVQQFHVQRRAHD